MEDDILSAPMATEVILDSERDRPLSPIEGLVGGAVDGRPLETSGNPLENVLLANFKLLKALYKDNLPAKEKKKMLAALESISTEQVKMACNDPFSRTMKSLTSFEDFTMEKVLPPRIRGDGTDIISTSAFKDFACRVRNGYFGSMTSNNISMKDMLSAVTEVSELYNLSPKGTISLIKRCMREPARTFLDNLVSSNISLKDLFDQLQENFTPRMSGVEASRTLGKMLGKPIENLDSFLTDLLNYSIAAQASFPVKQQSTMGQLLANSHLLDYIQKMYPALFPVLVPDIKRIQTSHPEPEALYRALMQLLRAHRTTLEQQPRGHGRISEIVSNPLNDIPQQQETNAEASGGLEDSLKNQIAKGFEGLASLMQGFSLSGNTQPSVEEMGNQPWVPATQGRNNPSPRSGNIQNPNVGYTRNTSLGNMGNRYSQQNNPQRNPRRLIVSEEEFRTHFANGACFRCGMTDHIQRHCPHIKGYTETKCPSCFGMNIVAYHPDCQGRIGALHKQRIAKMPQHVSEIFYPEEGPLLWVDLANQEPQGTYDSKN